MTSDLNDLDLGADPPADAPQTGPSGNAPAGTDQADAARLVEERDQLRDRLLRTTAEFDNYRKRIERERREMADRAAESLLLDLLPLVDDLERALAAEASGGGEPADAYRRGVELIHRQMLDLLARRGVTPMEALGADFDPHLHQAVASEAVEGHRDGEVIDVLRKGYVINDRLLRPAMVKVAQA
jgi:molecular chaperone GrpE